MSPLSDVRRGVLVCAAVALVAIAVVAFPAGAQSPEAASGPATPTTGHGESASGTT